MAIDRHEVARVMREISVLLQLKGESTYKVRAYDTAALRLEELSPEVFEKLVREKRLKDEVAGIGESLQLKIVTLVETGKLP